MSNTGHRIGVAWARFRANLRRKPYGVTYKGVVYLNKAAIKVMRGDDK